MHYCFIVLSFLEHTFRSQSLKIVLCMKVDILAGSLDASLTARTLPLSKALESYGVECEVVTPIEWSRIAKGKLGKIFSIILTHPSAKYAEVLRRSPEIILMQRVSTPQIYLFQKLLSHKGVKVIFDLNDALFLNTGRFLGIKMRPGSFYLEKVIRSANFVTVNGHYLLGYVKSFNRNVTILHDPVNTKLFSPTHRRKCDKVTIGWEGNAIVNYDSLTILVDSLKKLAQKYDIRFKIASYLGDLRVKRLFNKLESLIEIDYGSDSWLPLESFAELLYDFDIMVAPLKNALWYEGKSALRVGLGMAMGIPVVASPVGEQKHVIKHGFNGFFAKSEEEWYKYLEMLIENDDLRKKIGKEARKTAERELSLEVNGRKLYRIIRKVLK